MRSADNQTSYSFSERSRSSFNSLCITTKMRAFAVAACGAAFAAAQAPTTYKLTSAPGGRFWGIGGISGGGATSRLLYSYPAQQRDEIMDFLFKPNFGASLHILKVEIGGGAQSTEGTEASHMYTPTDLNYERGYEWQLMVDAKQRNPSIQLGALPWTFPGWLDTKNPPGHKSPWTDINATATYIINWLKGARDVYNVTLDYLGGWNERGHSMAYFQLMRQMLDANGFQSTQLVCGDNPHLFDVRETQLEHEGATCPPPHDLHVPISASLASAAGFTFRLPHPRPLPARSAPRRSRRTPPWPPSSWPWARTSRRRTTPSPRPRVCPCGPPRRTTTSPTAPTGRPS